ncbi:unnamed protein product [Rodentolepis nana]|uniref:WD_REPEATS_REGION domain-containing protein n=1 Tax=Rodentolepis nana TaxID=102285 RepID=A0A0R3T9S5_RODNA|nr:unnamed protein product [Rodentolepis nana]
MGTAGAYSLSWSNNGRLAVASRDKRLAVFDVDRGEKKPVVLMPCHLGSKPWKAVFLDDSTVVTVGFGLEGSKEVAVWDLTNSSSPLERIRCNQSYGSVIMNYYRGNRFLFLSGRGDNGIQVYKYYNRSMNIAGQFQSPHSYRDICWMQQEYLDSDCHEIGRCFRLFLPDTSVVLSTGSRRRNNLFCTNPYQQDFGGPFGLANNQSCRKLSAPLIEPLSIRLQEGSLDASEDESDREPVNNAENFSKIEKPPTKSSRPESVFSKRHKSIMLNKKPSFGSGDYINGSMVAMHYSNGGRDGGFACNTYNNQSKSNDGIKVPPPIPPKSKTKRVFNGWKIIPDMFQDKLSRKADKKHLNLSCDLEKPRKEEKAHSLVKTSDESLEDLGKNTNSDDEIFIVTTAFSRKRNGVQTVHEKQENKFLETEDDEEAYATCSVSDLVAAFEAKAARIAAMETCSISSETMSATLDDSAPLSSLEISAGLPNQKNRTETTLVPERPHIAASNPMNGRAHLPPSRMYTSSNHARWSISHSPGVQMSPALRYMQRSQRNSLGISRSPSNSDNDENPSTRASPRRSSLRIPIPDNRYRSEDSVSETIHNNNSFDPPVNSFRTVTTNTAEQLRDRLYEFLENDLSDISTASIIDNKTKAKSKLRRMIKNDSSEHETIREDRTLRKPTQVITRKGDTNTLEETPTIVNSEFSEKPVYSKLIKPEDSNVSKTREQQERAVLRLIPSLAPISTSKLSLLDEFRLLHLQITSIDSQNLSTRPKTQQSFLDLPNSDFNPSFDEKVDEDSSITIRRYNAFDSLCTSATESDQQHEDKGLMCTSKMARTSSPTSPQGTIEDTRAFYDSYAPYLRDLESTVRRCCSVCETDVSEATTPAANQDTQEGKT